MHGGLGQGVGPAGHDERVAGGDDPEPSQTHEQQSSDRSVGGGGESVHHGDDDGADAQDTDDDHVDQLGDEVAVEAVVDPRHEASNSQETDANIVQFVEELGDMFTVTTDCVEQRRHAQAEDSTNKEEEEDEFLAERNISVTLITQGLHVEDDGNGDEGHESNQMSPDVASLGVKSKY